MKTTEENNPYEKKVLIIKSHIKEWVKEKGFHTQAKTYRALNDAVIDILEKAIIRTKLSKRRTISPQHI